MNDSLPTSTRVLVAWDGSVAAAAAFPVARAVAEQLGARVEILCVNREAMEPRRLKMVLTEAEHLGVSVRFESGDAADEIVRLTEAPDVALVVLTTHGRGIESDSRLGRVAEKIVARTTRPVLIVRPESLPQRQRDILKRLLVPLDGTPKTALALQPVSDLAVALGASVDLLYVAGASKATLPEPGSMAAPRYVDQPHHEWPQWADEVIDRLVRSCAGCPDSVPLRMFLVQGDIGDEIAKFARENETDAIVLVRRSRLQPGRAKTIRSVLGRTACLVIVVGGEEIPATDVAGDRPVISKRTTA